MWRASAGGLSQKLQRDRSTVAICACWLGGCKKMQHESPRQMQAQTWFKLARSNAAAAMVELVSQRPTAMPIISTPNLFFHHNKRICTWIVDSRSSGTRPNRDSRFPLLYCAYSRSIGRVTLARGCYSLPDSLAAAAVAHRLLRQPA